MRQSMFSAILLTPLIYLLYSLFVTGVDDPIKYIYTVTGATALTLLYITTSLSMVKRVVNFIRYRRTVGLFAFFYASLHFLDFVILDMELDPLSALDEVFDKPFIALGMSAFVILLFMAASSQGSLFPKLFKHHKVIYIAIILTTIHFVMAQKALSIQQWEFLAVMGVIAAFKVWQRRKYLRFWRS